MKKLLLIGLASAILGGCAGCSALTGGADKSETLTYRKVYPRADSTARMTIRNNSRWATSYADTSRNEAGGIFMSGDTVLFGSEKCRPDCDTRDTLPYFQHGDTLIILRMWRSGPIANAPLWILE